MSDPNIISPSCNLSVLSPCIQLPTSSTLSDPKPVNTDSLVKQFALAAYNEAIKKIR